MSDLPEIVCLQCEFRFSVVWSNNWEASQGERQVNFCPRCGMELQDTDLDEEE